MTIRKLHQILGDLIDQGHARKPVRVDKRSFGHPLEIDGCSILDVEEIEVDWIQNLDGDGAMDFREDGSEAGQWTCVLKGDWDATPPQQH